VRCGSLELAILELTQAHMELKQRYDSDIAAARVEARVKMDEQKEDLRKEWDEEEQACRNRREAQMRAEYAAKEHHIREHLTQIFETQLREQRVEILEESVTMNAGLRISNDQLELLYQYRRELSQISTVLQVLASCRLADLPTCLLPCVICHLHTQFCAADAEGAASVVTGHPDAQEVLPMPY
jgi:hypothetical protein